MRILFVHSIGRKKYGGGERWVVNAAAGLRSKGHDVRVACRSNSVLMQEVEKRGVPVVRFNMYSDISLWQALRLAIYIRKHKIEVLLCKGHELMVCGLAARLSGMPLLIRRAGSPPQRKSRKLVWRTRRFVDGVVTNTNTILEVYREHGLTEEGLVKVIYNGLQIFDEEIPFDFEKTYPEKIIGLCLGRAVAHKGYFYLVDALVQLQKNFPGVLFYVLGDGKDRERLMAYARERDVDSMIVFAGYQHNPVPYLKGCHFFLHPSLYEGMPNAAMEAMAYGKPVIMTRVNGADELSENGKFAHLIPAADSDAIVGAVEYAMVNYGLFLDMGLQAQEHVRARFGMQTMINTLEGFILERMETRKNRKNLKKQQ